MAIEAKFCCSYCLGEISNTDTHVYQGRNGGFFHYGRTCGIDYAASGDSIQRTLYILWTRQEALQMLRDSLEGRVIPLVRREEGKSTVGSFCAR